MIEPSRLSLEHRVGTPPGTAEMIGTLATPTGGHVQASFGRGAVVRCWWPRRPALATLRAFHHLHGFTPVAPRRRRAPTPRRPAA
jgi:hypothetical protein